MRVTKIAKQIKFKGVWGELAPAIGFEKQPVAKYLKLTLVFMWSSTLRESFDFRF